MFTRKFWLVLLLSLVVPAALPSVYAADITPTAADVEPFDGTCVLVSGLAGEGLTSGQCVFKDNDDGFWYKLDCDDTATTGEISPAAGSIGVKTFGGTGTSDKVYIAISGPLVIAATVTPGRGYYNSDTTGGICPGADIEASTGGTDIPIFLGTCIDDSPAVIHLGPVNHKTAVP